MAKPSPGDLRSARKRALEIGTNPSGFTGGPEGYCAQCGTPMSAGHSHPSSTESPAIPNRPSPHPVPFKVGG